MECRCKICDKTFSYEEKDVNSMAAVDVIIDFDPHRHKRYKKVFYEGIVNCNNCMKPNKVHFQDVFEWE